MTACIAGLGAWFPETERFNDFWPEDFARRARERGDRTFLDIPERDDRAGQISSAYLRAEAHDPFIGATVRRIADEETTAEEAETSAACEALADAGIHAEEVDYVISYAASTREVLRWVAPGVAAGLGARRAVCFDMQQACATLIPQLITARALVESGQARVVLLTQSHLLTRTFPLLHPALPGLGDAASALVVAADRGMPLRAITAHTYSDYKEAIIWQRRDRSPWWKAGEDIVLGSYCQPQVKELMGDTVAYGARTLGELFAQAGVQPHQIGTFASVQPRGWIPRAIAECTGMPVESVSCTYDRYAHLGAAGPIVNWLDARQRGRTQGPTALYAQGAGFSCGAVLVDAA